jgi:hypothetical protein
VGLLIVKQKNSSCFIVKTKGFPATTYAQSHPEYESTLRGRQVLIGTCNHPIDLPNPGQVVIKMQGQGVLSYINTHNQWVTVSTVASTYTAYYVFNQTKFNKYPKTVIENSTAPVS